MMKASSYGLPLFALFAGSAIHMSGNYDLWLVKVLSVFLIMDLVAYLLAGKIKDSLVWKEFVKETMKRVILVGIIAISYVCDQLLGTGDLIKNSTLLFYISYEMATIISYGIKVGIPMPEELEKLVGTIINGNKK